MRLRARTSTASARCRRLPEVELAPELELVRGLIRVTFFGVHVSRRAVPPLWVERQQHAARIEVLAPVVVTLDY